MTLQKQTQYVPLKHSLLQFIVGKNVSGGSESMSAESKFSLILLALQYNRWLRRQRTCLQQGDLDSIPRLGECPGEGNGNTFQYSCLENPWERGAWRPAVHGVANSWTLWSYSFMLCKLLRMDYLQKHTKWKKPAPIFIKWKKKTVK